MINKWHTFKLITAVLLFTTSLPNSALSWETGKDLTQVTFNSVDTDKDNKLSYDELKVMVDDSAFSMDADQNNSITIDEFTEWDFGYYFLAQKEGNLESYKTAKQLMFNLIDFDQNKVIDPKEMQHAINTDFKRADFDKDTFLSETEFTNVWIPLVVLKTIHDTKE